MAPAACPAHEMKRRLVLRLGLAQLINWGVSFYIPGAFAAAIIQDTRWQAGLVHAGLSLALLVMGLVSPLSGGWIERWGGRRVMCAGSLLNAAGCLLLAGSGTACQYLAAWLVLGVGMRLSLYDAAFATLAALLGPDGRKAMVQVTLFGGLSTSLFWPLGGWLADTFGWRAGLTCFAVSALLGWALLLGLPGQPPAQAKQPTAIAAMPLPRVPARLYGLAMALTAFLASGLSAHMTSLLASHGLPTALAALWGVGQVGARLADCLQRRSLPALHLNLWVGVALPACFALGLVGLGSAPLAGLFVLAYGALNGLATLLRASLPLELFATEGYAQALGRLLAPAFLLAAVAPWVYALVRSQAGDMAMLWLSLAIALGVLSSAVALHRLRRAGP
ncbi:MFS transporter [Pseudomonas sp. CR3202]|uniref:MFS transporter n=1 Tax=Pseudomonas sp. CR3202 TaxID=3351532 RepID=UPI003BF2492B